LKKLGTAAIALLVVALAALAAGCGSTKKSAPAGTGTGSNSSCAKGDLHLVSAGKLTVGTDNPAFPPWFGGNPKSPWKVSDPRSGKGFESAVAYAVAKQLGFSKSEVDWKHVPFSNRTRRARSRSTSTSTKSRTRPHARRWSTSATPTTTSTSRWS
jgi:polar amino acid transport system substrate-binding protein